MKRLPALVISHLLTSRPVFATTGLVLGLMLASTAGAETVALSDSFTNSAGRPSGSSLAGSTTEVGNQVWVAAGELVVANDAATNAATTNALLATVPLTSLAGSDQSTFVVEANVDPSSSDWVGIGFNSQADDYFWTSGEVWMFLRADGQLHVRAEGLTHSLYDGFPSSFVAGPNRLRLQYWRGGNTVRAWLNDVEVVLEEDDLDTFGFAPSLDHAGFQGHKDASFAVNGLMLDDFVVTSTESAVPDAGFEEATGSWSEWSSSSFPASSLWSSSWGTTTPHTGSKAYSISNQAYAQLYTDLLTIDPSTQYELSALLKGEIDAEQSYAGVRIRAAFYDSAGTRLSDAVVFNDTSFDSSVWQRFGDSFTSPSDATKLRVELLSFLSAGWVAFDDVELLENSSGPNLVPDPGFEESPTAWTTWTYPYFPATSTWRGNWGPAGGNGYAYVISNHAYGQLRSPRIDANPDTAYELFAWVKGQVDTEASYAALLMRVYFYDAGGGQLGFESVHLDQAFNAADWEQRGGGFTTPTDTAEMQLVLYCYLANGWIAFDDVELIEVGGGNLLGDPGFELDNGWWTPTPLSSFPGTGMWRNTWGPIRSGNAAFVIGNLAFAALTSAPVDVLPNTNYDLTMWMRGEIDPEATMFGAQVRASHSDQAGELLRQDIFETWTPQSTTWEQRSFWLRTPVDAATTKIHLYNLLGSGWVAFDDVELVQTSATTSAPPQLGIESLPGHLSVEAGLKVTMECEARGGATPYEYRWQYGTDGASFADIGLCLDGCRISGSRSRRLTIYPVKSGDEGYYRCRVTPADPTQAPVESTAAYLEVLPASPDNCVGVAPESSGVFTDVADDHWAGSAIMTIATAGIMEGCGGSFFCPDDAVTNEDLAVFFSRLAWGRYHQPPRATGIFSDVPTEYCYACWIENAATAGVSTGCVANGGTFCPFEPVTRAKAALNLLVARDYLAPDGHYPPTGSCQGYFDDVPCDHEARAYIEELYELGITDGCGGGNFCPDKIISRAELAALIAATLDSIP